MFHTSSFAVDLPHAILDVLPNPVFVKAPDRTYLWVNPAFETLFGVCRDDVIGRTDIAALQERRGGDDQASDARVLETGTQEDVRQTVTTADGEIRDVMIRKSRLALPDGAACLVCMVQDVTEMAREAQKLADLVNTDDLTGALTRRALSDAVAAMGARAYGVLMLDIDHFKSINDTYGHAAGDQALAHFCDTIRGHLRADDALARIGGEEFAVIVPGICAAKLAGVAERLVEAVRAAPVPIADGPLKMSVSIGGASVPYPGSDPTTTFEAALKTADGRLYDAKEGGRDRAIVG